jgi:hypothetical protein
MQQLPKKIKKLPTISVGMHSRDKKVAPVAVIRRQPIPD